MCLKVRAGHVIVLCIGEVVVGEVVCSVSHGQALMPMCVVVVCSPFHSDGIRLVGNKGGSKLLFYVYGIHKGGVSGGWGLL